MTTVIGMHEQYALVPPLEFVSAMTDHWTQTLRMPSSSPLRSLWQKMGNVFERTIIDNISECDARWKVLQPPTGSGKTQGACLYSAMQAKRNRDALGNLKPVGVLLVTRLIKQADDLAAQVNVMAGANVAVAHHSKSETDADDIGRYDVLVVTHQAFVNAAETLAGASWSRLVQWKGGHRLLTIVDEALANVVEENKVTLESLQFVLGCVPFDVAQAFPDQVRLVEALKDALVQQAQSDTNDGTAKLMWRDGGASEVLNAAPAAMKPLREAMRKVKYDRRIREGNTKRNIAKLVEDTLASVQALADRWAYYTRIGKDHSLNSSTLTVSYAVPGAVVLDATASQNFLWELFQGRAQIEPVCAGARNYRNVTLHVARAKGVGKTTMEKTFAARYARLLEALEAQLGSDRSVFVCVHKDYEHSAERFKHPFKRVGFGHWGAVDGRNDWKDYDTAVLFGLPYRDLIWPTNVFFALQGVQDDVWLKTPTWKGYTNVRRLMQQRQMSVEIIQAINRIRCRKVVDEDGGCDPADVFIVLPADSMGDAILTDIKADMPDIEVVPWSFEMDGPKVRRPREGSSHQPLLTLMRNTEPGESVPLSTIQRELALKPAGLSKLREVLRNDTHATSKALVELGVKYVSGRGPGAKSFLVKQQVA
ncbi:hypothetical protein ACMA5K_27155 [Bradyrhizobium diazoefficiens]|uniref:Uncharacterized protein n=2 Tax=Bradyrhizobium diazoefficiens TaxID=1355477 RepID=A0A809Z7U5_9BRAD|nr:hypothetical protein [Bradyrhizobium diazoefficiens]BBZ94527.1 hypothetical protein F07S3_43600 [Bradyrhizobium diazoefficiens]BCA12209.1 hypothetical protein BDHF08_40560 [Bradyrhizobium diazoefficiens]BCE21480.1 hypothetical protein XF1B_41610 [Bradyrhizobium diazoefficiens]BCE47727.1 hypothetical protein XF4B_40760 [Bradyrhizobium diazoefficiens]BCE56615.1 hypothetical protein XF5B_41270 [Bradyrhizobium diazoefficiens]